MQEMIQQQKGADIKEQTEEKDRQGTVDRFNLSDRLRSSYIYRSVPHQIFRNRMDPRK